MSLDENYPSNVVYINQIEDMEKGKKRILFDTGVSCVLYHSELRGLVEDNSDMLQRKFQINDTSKLSQVQFQKKENSKLSRTRLDLKEGSQLSQAQYDYILYEIVAKRAKKRVLYLLEKMDRTEQQIREKLKANEYPDCCIEIAIAYAKSFHYLDDYRYACNFVRYHMEKYSRMQIKQKLLSKGISRDDIERAIEAEYISEEKEQIRALLQKKKFQGQTSNTPEFRKIYQFLLRRGFSSSDILKEMNNW